MGCWHQSADRAHAEQLYSTRCCESIAELHTTDALGQWVRVLVGVAVVVELWGGTTQEHGVSVRTWLMVLEVD